MYVYIYHYNAYHVFLKKGTISRIRLAESKLFLFVFMHRGLTQQLNVPDKAKKMRAESALKS
jgi:hypothetical protein